MNDLGGSSRQGGQLGAEQCGAHPLRPNSRQNATRSQWQDRPGGIGGEGPEEVMAIPTSPRVRGHRPHDLFRRHDLLVGGDPVLGITICLIESQPSRNRAQAPWNLVR